MRLSLHIAAFKHRLLRFCSKSYRSHDAIVSERDRWRRDCITAGNEKSTALARLQQIEEVSASLRERLKNAIEAQQKASEQLIAERALRQAADERAERYHDEVSEALKSAANWSAKALNRKSMFGEDAPDPQREGAPVALPSKRMARSVTQEVSSSTLREMFEQMRGESVPVGPEFTTQ